MQFSLAYSSHRHKHAALSASIFPESVRPRHGVAMWRTLKVLRAYSCNNHPSLALKLHPPPPTPRTHQDTFWLIQAGHLLDFPSPDENCESFSFVLLCEQLSAAVLFSCFSPTSLACHTHAACTARSEHWYCCYTFRVLLGGLALWIFNRRSITGTPLCSYRWVNSGVWIKCVARCLVSYRKPITERDSMINQ